MTPAPASLVDAQAAPAAARIRRRLLERVADEEQRLVTVAAGDGAWQPVVAGVMLKLLHEQDGTLSCLLRFEPGAGLPAHRHPRDEECIVLEGWLRVGTRIELGPGGYHRARAGALHARIVSPTGATVFLRGAVPEVHHELA